MNGNPSIMANNNATFLNPSTSSISQHGKMKINPLQLLTALSILLNGKGGIKSLEEVKRVSGLMSKYSKKLVSKCIYLNILEATESDLLNQFFTEDGWKLVCTWLNDAISTSNWPLTKQILNLLLVSPVTVDRLKQNNSPKMVKDLSKDCDNIDVKTVAEQVVQNWKLIVVQGAVASAGTAEVSEPQELETPVVEETPLVGEETVSEMTTIDPGALREDNNTYAVPAVDAAREQLSVKRGRGSKAGRGRGRPRGRPKVEAPSYADLLKQDLDHLSGQDTPINITIRNGSKVLAKVSSKKGNKEVRCHSSSIDSTDSEDNIPLSLIRKEVKSTSDVETETPAEIISIESSDSQTMSDASSVSTEKISSDDKSKAKAKENAPTKVDNKGKKEEKRDNKAKNEKEGKRDSKLKNEKEVNRDKKPRMAETQAKDKDSSHKSRDRSHRSKDKGSRSNDGDRDRSKNNKDKSKTSDRHRDRRDADKKSEHRSKDKERSKDKHRNKSESRKTSDNNHSSHDKRKDEEKEKPKSQDQTKLDQATLNKVKPLSTEGLARIPRKPSSFLDALSAADSENQEEKKPAIKTKSRGFRNTGLLDETIRPPGMAGRRSVENSCSPPIKRQRPSEFTLPDKRIKSSVSSDPSAMDRPGGIKLISPKRPTIADDGGFMAALTAAGVDRKKISKKRRSSDSEQKPEASKFLRMESEESDDKNSDVEIPNDETIKTEPMLSPTSIRPILNFYKETLKDDSDDVKKNEDDKEKSEEIKMDTENDYLEQPGSPVDQTMTDQSPEKSPKKLKEYEEMAVEEPAVPAPAQEDYETIEVLHTSLTDHLKSVLVYHRDNDAKRKKKVQWKVEENLTQTFFFPMDENERVNVNTLKFQDMMQRDRAFEKETLGKSRGRFGSPDLNPNPVNTCTEFLPWKLFPIHLPEESSVGHGSKSKEKHVQAQREHLTMGIFFHPAMRPDTPSEPDAEMVPRSEPVAIPLTDVSGSDSFSDHRNIPWPEPVVAPPEVPFMPPAQNQMPPSHDGGHWIVGGHPTPRFGGDMFNGPPGVCGPPINHSGGGFPGPNPAFVPKMRGPPCPPGNWGGMGPQPNDFGGPLIMQGGPAPHMNMGPNMGGPGMGAPAPRMGGPGPPMNMGGPGMGGRGGPRFKRGNWGPQQNLRPCKHFMNGHCRNGNNCRFAHNQQR